MNFKPELAAKVMAGEKTVTRRLTSKNPRSPWCEWKIGLTVGRDYAVCPGRGKNAIGRVRILQVSSAPLGYIGETEARWEGFASEDEFYAAWEAINGTYDPDTIVWRVQFEVAS